MQQGEKQEDIAKDRHEAELCSRQQKKKYFFKPPLRITRKRPKQVRRCIDDYFDLLNSKFHSFLEQHSQHSESDQQEFRAIR